MSDYRDTMRAVAARTAPDAEAVTRVRRRLDAQLQPTTSILRHLDDPSPFEVERLRRRLRGPHLPKRRSLAWPAVGLLAAAVSLFVLGTRSGTGTSTELTLSASESASVSPSPLLRMDYLGEGTLSGADPAWLVEWEHGTVSLAVTPDAGADVRVRTLDAEVRVLGTQFDVTRDELGTAVEVVRGRVEVLCTLGESAVLTAGETHACWPATPAGLLGRALALSDRGASPEARLATLDAGLQLAPTSDPAHAELLAHRIQPLLDQGSHREALGAAEAYLDVASGARAEELRHVAAHLALALEGCSRALPHLRGLGEPTPEERARLEACQPD